MDILPRPKGHPRKGDIMKEQFDILHKQMLTDIERCLSLELPEVEKIESAYRIAQNYWERVKKTVTDEFLVSESNEIDFFRNIKPRFTSHIEYFLIIYQAVLFLTDHPENQIGYWEEETNRYKRFCDKQKEFIDYFESRSHYLDSVYFTRKNFNPNTIIAPKPYDIELEFCTSHDSLVASLLANRMYFQFVNKRIAELKMISFKTSR